jgi:predicted methyltransferase
MARFRFRPFAAASLMLAAAFLWTAAALAALADAPCGPREMFIEQLADRYGEGTAVTGIDANGSVMEILANSGTGTWTMILTTPEGVTCLVVVGEALEIARSPPGDPA